MPRSTATIRADVAAKRSVILSQPGNRQRVETVLAGAVDGCGVVIMTEPLYGPAVVLRLKQGTLHEMDAPLPDEFYGRHLLAGDTCGSVRLC